MARYIKLLIDKGMDGHPSFIGLFSIPELQAFSNNVNVALNKPVTVRSIYAQDMNGSNLVNGIIGNHYSGWATSVCGTLTPNGSEWAIIDLQNNYNIDKIIIDTYLGGGYSPITDYRIMFSNDGTDYWLASSFTNGANTTRTDIIDNINNGFYSLYKTGNIVYGVNNGFFEQISTNWDLLTNEEQENLFKLTNYKNANVSDLANLNNFKVLKYQNSNTQTGCTVTAVPKDQLILPKGLLNIESFESIDKISLASNTTNNGVLKILVTNDLSNYKIYDFVNNIWQNINHTNIVEVLDQGINVSDIQNITHDSWDIITSNKSGIGFAYLLTMENTTDVCEVDKISLTVDMKGAWEKSIHGSDYKYGYPSNKTLRVKLLANGDYKINYSEGAKNP